MHDSIDALAESERPGGEQWNRAPGSRSRVASPLALARAPVRSHARVARPRSPSPWALISTPVGIGMPCQADSLICGCYPQFHGADSRIERMYQRHLEHASGKRGSTLSTESWNEPRFG